MKMRKIMQKEGQNRHTGLGREKLCKNFGGKRQKKSLWSLADSEREKKSFEKMFEQVKTEFLKNLIHDVRLIEKQVRSIEPGRDSLKILKRISIDRKIDWINRKSRKTSFQKNNLIFENIPQSIEYKK